MYRLTGGRVAIAAAVSIMFGASRFGALRAAESRKDTSCASAAPQVESQQSPLTAVTTSPATPRADAVRRIVAEYAARGSFRGAVLLATGQEVVEAFAGAADSACERANGPDTLFRMGSISKHVAAAAVLALAERGGLDLDDPVAKHLRDYPAEHLQHDGQPLRISHLLTHTSGLPDALAASDTSLVQRFLYPMLGSVSLPALRAQPLTNTPGARYSYNNANYDLVGVIVERTAKIDFDRWLRSEVGGYGLGILPTPAERARLAKGYLPVAGTFVEIGRGFGLDVERVATSDVSGNMFASARGLYAWFRDLLAAKIIAQGSVRALLSPRQQHYGYGLRIDTVHDELRVSHAGAIAGFASELEFYPKRGAALIVLSNSDSSGIAMAALLEDLRCVLDAPGPYRAQSRSSAAMHVLATVRNVVLLALGDHPLALMAQLVIASLIALAVGRICRNRWHAASAGALNLAGLMLVLTLVDTHLLQRSVAAATAACSLALSWRATPHTAVLPSVRELSSLLAAAVLTVMAVSWRASSAWTYVAGVALGFAVAAIQPHRVVKYWRPGASES